jgi:hypothetical protein
MEQNYLTGLITFICFKNGRGRLGPCLDVIQFFLLWCSVFF